ncbi:glycosyl transferase family 2 [Lachnotalea glycerini]|uniref:Glycosyl transferase family 2 n=1 Tax=Lachnotalea glycerini TaxID=1763509 RepID=A0A318ELV0_9FIRM|nr:glycosyltransferase family 2 protein [Lachnotalea glycerini]PXV90159.1 glycosyl transferase family 2 [Lachnotalea glycerini]
MNELISVIVPVYKVEQYIRRCVDSIINQSYSDLEIILVDDESPDGCPEICEEYSQRDERIKVIHQKNKGLSGARNAGIDLARGEYIAFVDSDDFLAMDFIQILYQAIKKSNSDIAMCKYEYVKGDYLTQSHKAGESYVYTGVQMIEKMYSPDGAFFVVAWNKIYKKDLFDQVRYPNGRIHEDEATTHRLYYAAKQAVFVDWFLYGYFVGGESITRKKFNRNRLDWAWSVEQRLNFLEEKGLNEILPIAIRSYADGIIDLFFQCKNGLPDSKKEQQMLREKVRDAARRNRQYGTFPMKTRIGYTLFYRCPMIYQKLLQSCSAPVLKEKVMEHYDKE